MAGIQNLFDKIKNMDDEIRRLKGRLNSISIGNQIIQPNIPGTAAVPTATEGALISGNATPAWERLSPPTPTIGQKFDLTFWHGDTQAVWRTGGSGSKYRQFVYEVSGGSFTFITDLDGNPIFTLLETE